MQTDLLTLDFAGVAGHETSLTQRRLQRFVVFDEGAGDAEANGAGLTRDAATSDGDHDIKLVDVFGQFERLTHDHARGLATEELVERLTVDDDATGALAEEHAGGGGLAAAGTVILLGSHVSSLDFQRLGHLRGVRVLGTAVHLELAVHGTT